MAMLRSNTMRFCTALFSMDNNLATPSFDTNEYTLPIFNGETPSVTIIPHLNGKKMYNTIGTDTTSGGGTDTTSGGGTDDGYYEEDDDTTSGQIPRIFCKIDNRIYKIPLSVNI